jgi:hypothetical protein
MRALFALMCASLLCALPASAGSRQGGIICNHADAIAAAAYFRFFGDTNEPKQVAWLVSTPTKWCIPGFVRESRPNSSKMGLEHVQADLDASHVLVQELRGMASLMSSVLVITPLPIGGLLFESTLASLPETMIDMREFKRENGRPGYYISIVERIPETRLRIERRVDEEFRRDMERSIEKMIVDMSR